MADYKTELLQLRLAADAVEEYSLLFYWSEGSRVNFFSEQLDKEIADLEKKIAAYKKARANG